MPFEGRCVANRHVQLLVRQHCRSAAAGSGERIVGDAPLIWTAQARDPTR